MSNYLIELSFGPVQGFIASARRSRDLWAGSYILSSIARAAGKSLLENGAIMIYPSESRIKEDNENENSNLSNVLLAQLPEANAAKAKEVAHAAIDAAKTQLKAFSDEALKAWKEVGCRKDLWELQVADAIEAYAAWAELSDDYVASYKKLKSTFASRKNTRNFGVIGAANADWASVPKNSFDGLRESVLPKVMKDSFRRRFGLSANEQLDALGCIKRVVGKRERFTALTRIAAHDWLKSLPQDKLTALSEAYETLVKLELATRTTSVQFSNFQYDAGLLFPERLDRELGSLRGSHPDDADAIKAINALNNLKSILLPIWKERGKPCPYAAMVVADGDRMGVFVSAAQSAEDHMKITHAVASFADQVPVLASQFGGQSVFNGGEDLTVLYPLSGVIKGAQALAQAFNTSVNDTAISLLKDRFEQDRPTLRVGVAICHVLEPLGVIRQWGDAAEKYAKGQAGTAQQGNAVGLVLHIRAGHEIGVRLSFDDKEAFEYLGKWQTAYTEGKLPARIAYDCRAIGLECKAKGFSSDVAEAELLRLLDRARIRGGDKKIGIDDRNALIERRKNILQHQDKTNKDADPTGLLHLADELILARWLSAKSAKDLNSMEGSM